MTEQQSKITILVQQGLDLHQHGKLNDAQNIYEQILSIQEDNFDALQLLGALFAQVKKYPQAVESLSKALIINPNHAGCYSNLGFSFQKLQRLEEALSSYDKAISLQADYAEAYSNRGLVLQELQRLEEALSSYDKAISLQANYAEAYCNRGTALHKLKRLEEALSSYDKAISLQADFAEAYLSSSLCYLLAGNFNDGWPRYEWRWQSERMSKTAGVRNFSQPLWLGIESLKDQTILLYAEQGLGDTIQFSRYVSLVAMLGAKVVLEVQPSLVKLLSHLEGISQIINKGDKLPHFDYQCPLLSLPLAFKTELQTIPSVSQNISSDIEKVAKWQAILGEKTKPRVGIVWSGSATHKNDHQRSLTLSQLITYLPSDYEYVSLQKEISDVDKEVLTKHYEIKHFGGDLKDFTDTAALCELIDIVISIDTSVAHLAGTLGKTTWILLPYSPDWRWLLDRNDSPWYSSVKLYRQEKINDWDGVLVNIESDLKGLRNGN